jgi:hypothetical protein
MANVHGRVQVDASSTVTARRTLSGATRVKRSVSPGSLYNDTVSQLDFTVMKNFRVGHSVDVRPDVSLFNLFNANPVLTQTNTYGQALGNALTILPARMVRLGLMVRF